MSIRTLPHPTDPDMFLIESDDDILFLTKGIHYMSDNLSGTEYGRMLSISMLISKNCSILMQEDGIPHTSETLSKHMSLSRDHFYRLMKRYKEKNVVNYSLCPLSGYKQKVYMVNPYLIRKTIEVDPYLDTFFTDVTVAIA